MWMTYVRVTTICRDTTSIRLQTQDSQHVPHETGVSGVSAACGGPRSPSASPSHGTVVTPGWPAEPRNQVAFDD